MTYLVNPDHRLRYRAAIALANLQDTSAVRYLIPLLMDEDPSVRQGAAFALGQIGSREAQQTLLGALKNQKEKSVISRILEALGRCGDQTGLEEVVEYTTSDSSLKREQALSVARFALRNLKSERSIWFCFDLIDDRDPEVQWRALYALWRSTPHGLIDIEISKRRDSLRKLAHSPSADVRMHLATLLGRSKSTDALNLLKVHQRAEGANSEWRVQVQLVRAFGSFAAKAMEHLEVVVGYLDSGNNHVRIAALQTIASLPREVARSSPTNEILRQKLLKQCVTRNEDAQVLQGEALVATGRHFPDELLKRVSIVSDEETSPLVRAKFLEGLSLNASGKSLEVFIDNLNDETSRVSMAAWDFVKRLFSPTSVAALRDQYANWSRIGEIMSGKIDSSLSRRDMGVSTLVANAVADSSFFSVLQSTGYAEKAVGELMNAYSNFSTPDDLEAMQAILRAFGAIKAKSAVPLLEKALNDPDRTVADEAVKALQRITGRDYSARIPRSTKPVYSDYDWELLESLSPTQTVLLKTSKGLIRLELLKEHAPFTVSSFVKLMKKRFFDGLNFHRVVPNFVVQGGDPRGDGWGGPGYALRSEYSLLNYQRGSVGVASAGKDTEGCQFFITHSPPPHLDGRYTIFARVVSGMEVVDKLQVGDKIFQMDLRN